MKLFTRPLFIKLWHKPRRYYPILFAIILWGTWIVTISLNITKPDYFLNTDYFAFYSAATILYQEGDTPQLYDVAHQSEVQQTIIGHPYENIFVYIMPPFFAQMFVPLAQLPYLPSLAIWLLVSCLLYAIALKLLAPQSWLPILGWSFTWFPLFTQVTFAQTTFFTIFVFALIFNFYQRQRLFAAGLVAALLLFKPPLLVGILFLWFLRWRNDGRALLGFFTGTALLGTLSLLLWPQSTQAYATFVTSTLIRFSAEYQFPDWLQHTVRSFWLLLLPAHTLLANLLWVLCALWGIWHFIRFVRLHANHWPLLFAASLCLMIWVSPHLLIYDVSILVIVATLLWVHVPAQRALWIEIYGWAWVIYLVSGAMVQAQMLVSPATLQISLIFLLGAFQALYMALLQQHYKTPP